MLPRIQGKQIGREVIQIVVPETIIFIMASKRMTIMTLTEMA